jgi:putative ABC transport system substrate-binding protein
MLKIMVRHKLALAAIWALSMTGTSAHGDIYPCLRFTKHRRAAHNRRQQGLLAQRTRDPMGPDRTCRTCGTRWAYGSRRTRRTRGTCGTRWAYGTCWIGRIRGACADDAQGRELVSALRQGLLDQGWAEGRSSRSIIDGLGDLDRRSVYAANLVASSPDVLLACYLAQLAPLAQQTRTIPMVFVGVSDPIGSGYVASFARPGGNITGFTLYEASLAGKWLEVLKTMAPAVGRVAFMINPETAVLRGTFYLRAFETAAAALALEPLTSNVHNADNIEAVIAALGERPGGGLIVAPETFSELHRELIVTLVARHRVPTVYGTRQFAMNRGLVSYGPNITDTFRRSASYVDREAGRSARTAPTKYELVINLGTAKANQTAITNDETGAKLPKRTGAWIYDRKMEIKATDEPSIAGNSSEILNAIERDGYFILPVADIT